MMVGWKHIRTTGVAMLLVLVAGACGDDGGTTPSQAGSQAGAPEATSEVATDVGSAPDVGNSGEATAYLHPTLRGLPLPPGAEVPFPADEYDADTDDRETVVQFISVQLPSDDVTRFLLAELPGAGFTVVDRGSPWMVTEADIQPGLEGWIYIETPDGLPAQVIIHPQGERTGININLYRAGEAREGT